MERTRGVIERALERGDPVYGVTRGVGALKTVSIDDAEQGAFNRALLVSHNVGHGPLAPPEVVRATMVTRAAGLALGYAGVRPVVAEALCAALNAGIAPRLHTIGSVGQADLSQMAEIGLALTGQTISADELRAAGLEPLELGPREAHAILNANAYTVGAACIALRRARRALDGLELAAALSYEAVLGNVDALHPAIGRARPYPGDERARARIAALLAGGALAQRRDGAAQPAGRALLQGTGPDARRRPRRARAPGSPAVDRARLIGRQPVRARRRGSGDLHRRPRDRPGGAGARPRAAGARRRRDDRLRADPEAAGSALHRSAHRSARAARQRRGRPGDRRPRGRLARRRGPAAGRAGDARAAHLVDRGGDRGPRDDGPGRGHAAALDERADRPAGGGRAALRRPGRRSPGDRRGARDRHVGRATGSSAGTCPRAI